MANSRWRMDLQPLVLVLLCVLGAVEGHGVTRKLIPADGHLDLGQRWGWKTPLLHTKINLREVTSMKSTFEFRTLDPEGLVLYGDTLAGTEWFVLALRGGIPEMQIGKSGAMVVMAGGPRLDDGHWHQVQLRGEGHLVVLEVNGTNVLVMGLHSKHAEEDTAKQMRLSLGGILVKDLEIFNPLQLEMDGCVRAGNWLNLSQPWDTDLAGPPRACFAHIRRGSFFPGTGLAIFNSSDYPTAQESITIEMEGPIGDWTGTLLSILTSQHEAILTIVAKNQTQKLEVTCGEQTASVPLTQAELMLNLSEHMIQIVLGNSVVAELKDNMRDWPSIWDEGLLLAIGGVPESVDYSSANGSSHHLHGCVWAIRIQNQEVDLDRALYKHNSVFSHSCPISPDILEPSPLLTADL